MYYLNSTLKSENNLLHLNNFLAFWKVLWHYVSSIVCLDTIGTKIEIEHFYSKFGINIPCSIVSFYFFNLNHSLLELEEVIPRDRQDSLLVKMPL